MPSGKIQEVQYKVQQITIQDVVHTEQEKHASKQAYERTSPNISGKKTVSALPSELTKTPLNIQKPISGFRHKLQGTLHRLPKNYKKSQAMNRDMNCLTVLKG